LRTKDTNTDHVYYLNVVINFVTEPSTIVHIQLVHAKMVIFSVPILLHLSS